MEYSSPTICNNIERYKRRAYLIDSEDSDTTPQSNGRHADDVMAHHSDDELPSSKQFITCDMHVT